MEGLAINLADALFISNEALPFGHELRPDARNKASGLFIPTSVRQRHRIRRGRELCSRNFPAVVKAVRSTSWIACADLVFRVPSGCHELLGAGRQVPPKPPNRPFVSLRREGVHDVPGSRHDNELVRLAGALQCGAKLQCV